MTKNPYEILGVGRDATEEEILKAFRKKSMSTHADKGGNDELQKDLNLARDILLDPKKRADYDKGKPEFTSSAEQAKQVIADWVVGVTCDKTLADKSLLDLLTNALRDSRVENELPKIQIMDDMESMHKRLEEARMLRALEGDNLFTVVISGMIDNANKQLAEIEHNFDVMNEIERILIEYYPPQS